MTASVVSVGPDAPIDAIARLLLQHGISAAPVIGPDGALLGMVSEGDLIGRNDTDRAARRDWWLTLLADGETLDPGFLASLQSNPLRARQVMATPVFTVTEATDVADIARVLVARRVKRVPVLAAGRVVGIVSRSDLLGLLAGQPTEQRAEQRAEPPVAPAPHIAAANPAANPAAAPPSTSAEGFRALEDAFKVSETHDAAEAKRIDAEKVALWAKDLAEHHVEDKAWQALLQGARRAAQKGGQEFLLLRFPSDLCADRGRAINVAGPDWPQTLRGEAAEIYARWERDLKPNGFHLSARVLDFPGGFPGDVGLYVIWN